MNIYFLTSLVNALGSLVIGTFVFTQNRKSNVHRRFLFFTLSVAFWAFSYCQWQITTVASHALFWTKALMVGAIFVPVTYFHFILSFLGISKRYKKFLILSYLLFFIFFIFNFTPLFVNRVEPELNFKHWPKPGLVYHPFLFFWFAYVIYATYLLFKAHKTAEGLKKIQIKYLLTGMLIGYAGGATNYFLWYDIPIPPIGNGLVVFNVLIIAYTILRHHLFNIKVIATELFTGLLLFFLLLNVFAVPTLTQKVLNGVVFLGATIFGYLLIRSVLKEIQYRRRLQIAYRELKRLDETKSEFISMASHQLRTPLSAIKGYISMILEGIYGKPPPKMKKPLENVFTSNERLIGIVEDLLNISKIEMGRIEIEKEKVQIEDLIEEVYNEMRIKAKEKNLSFKWEKPKKPLPQVVVDPLKIKQVISNVVDNAIRYTQKGGVEINVKCQMSNVKILVKDTGEGLTKKEISMLFESFSRGLAGMRFWTEGAGLGLYIAKKYLELHNGRIWAESSGKRKGSTFYIEIPIK